MGENECEELISQRSVPRGACGWAVPEMKDLQKLRCDEFAGEDTVLSLGSLLGLQDLIALS